MQLLKKASIVTLAVVLLLAVGTIVFVYVTPKSATNTFIAIERWRAGLKKHEIEINDRLNYVYLTGGRGEPLLLLHGFGANKDTFLRLAQNLTGRYRLIIPDHIGFGESSKPAGADYSSQEQAKRLHQFVQKLGLGAFHLGGNSMGGHIALTYAERYPKQIKSLLLLNSGGVRSAPDTALDRKVRTGQGNQLLVQSPKDYKKLYDFVMYRPPFVPGPVLNVMAKERIANFELERKIFQDIRSDSTEARVKGLQIPTLIVWGKKDRVLHPRGAKILNRLLPRSEVFLLPGVGHLPQLEAPEKVAKQYIQFTSKLR